MFIWATRNIKIDVKVLVVVVFWGLSLLYHIFQNNLTERKDLLFKFLSMGLIWRNVMTKSWS